MCCVSPLPIFVISTCNQEGRTSTDYVFIAGCLGCWCPCVLFGQNVEMLEGKPWIGPCLMHFLLWGVVTGLCCALTEGTIVGVLGSCVPCYVCSYRKALRTRYNLEVRIHNIHSSCVVSFDLTFLLLIYALGANKYQ